MIKQEVPSADPTLDFISHSVAQTQRVGSRLAELLAAGDVLLLQGPLGSGKTVLTQGIAHGLGISAYIASPSFVLINEYRPKDVGGRLPLYHIDLYRLEDVEQEALVIGIEEYLYGSGVCVVEWADRAPHLFPEEHLLICLSLVSETKRGMRMIPHGSRYLDLLRAFKHRAFGI